MNKNKHNLKIIQIYQPPKGLIQTILETDLDNVSDVENKDLEQDIIIREEKIPITLCLNTNFKKKKSILVNPIVNINEIIRLSRNKYQFKPKVFYREYGEILENGMELEQEDIIYVSKGEKYMGK